jgi:hypothetical protein
MRRQEGENERSDQVVKEYSLYSDKTRGVTFPFLS